MSMTKSGQGTLGAAGLGYRTQWPQRLCFVMKGAWLNSLAVLGGERML